MQIIFVVLILLCSILAVREDDEKIDFLSILKWFTKKIRKGKKS